MFTEADIARFHSRYLPEPMSGCWLWEGALHYGYGTFSGKKLGRGYSIRAHRFSYLLHHGILPVGKLVCHSCDNRACVNPDHLWAGTESENRLDMYLKGRGTDRKGVKHPLAKLTESQVLDIFERVRAGGVQRVIAMEYGISRQLVSNIKLCKGWGHLIGESK